MGAFGRGFIWTCTDGLMKERSGSSGKKEAWCGASSRTPSRSAWKRGGIGRRFDSVTNEMFLRLAEHFLDVVGGGCEPLCTLRDGLNALRVVEACRQSSISDRAVTLDP